MVSVVVSVGRAFAQAGRMFVPAEDASAWKSEALGVLDGAMKGGLEDVRSWNYVRGQPTQLRVDFDDRERASRAVDDLVAFGFSAEMKS